MRPVELIRTRNQLDQVVNPVPGWIGAGQ
jgi:hypothetical protein